MFTSLVKRAEDSMQGKACVFLSGTSALSDEWLLRLCIDKKSNVYTIDYMKTAVVNFKTDEATKLKAQAVASKLGIPLSNLLNAYLYELATTGSVHFTTSEPMTKNMEIQIAQAEADIAAGRVSEPFKSLEAMYSHLDNL